MTAHSKTAKSRRDLLVDGARAACGVAAAMFALSVFSRQSAALPNTALRPPGALAEADFVSACIRCGLCVRDCPYEILALADLGEGPAHGTPFFVARTGPCELCDDIPCVAACPSGALDRALTDITQSKMGVAVLLGRESCLNLQGLRCDVCYRVCPLINEAITLDRRHNERTGKHAILEPIVHVDKCTGCGICEKACVLEEAAIKVLPTRLAGGTHDAHYQFGWEAKQEAGGELVPGLIDLPDRGPALPGGGS
ncbi:MAG: ferredoxin-type protein NapG [Cohaesibacter sp.]|nr:ferredoxin-type protein NapG [Cohaesibacter sp.]